jgi:hypothetical protein
LRSPTSTRIAASDVEDRVGLGRQHQREHEVQHEQQQGHGGQHQPHGQAAHQRLGHALHALPLAGQVALVLAALAPDHAVQAVAHDVELLAAVLDDAVAPFEAERDAHVHQLQQVDVAARILHRLLEQLEELLAAEAFAVQRDQQALLHPLGAGAPGHVGHGLVDDGAQRVAADQHVLGGRAGGARAGLELGDGAQQVVAQAGRVGVVQRTPDGGHRVEQDRRVGHQRVQAHRAAGLLHVGQHRRRVQRHRLAGDRGLRRRRAATARLRDHDRGFRIVGRRRRRGSWGRS